MGIFASPSKDRIATRRSTSASAETDQELGGKIVLG
jgi:hypothetical protein